MRTLAALGVCIGLCACELVADFDRGKLEMGSPDSGYAIPPEPMDDDAGAADAGSDDEDAEDADEDAGEPGGP